MADLDLMPDGVLVADADGVVIEVNQAALRILRASADRTLGRHIRDALPLDDLQGHHWFDCLDPYDGFAARTRLSEQTWHTPHGREILMTGQMVRVEPRGPVHQLVLCLRDARTRARRDRARSDLVATVAHELRSPLTGVKGFTATLLSKWDRFSDEQRQLMLETVDADADRLTRLITELLDAARIDSGRLTLRPEPVNLGAVVQRVLASVSGGGEVPTVRRPSELPTVWADPDRVSQVVTNLVENAHRHGQGLRSVTVEPADGGRDGVVITVSDRGPGVPADIRSRIFTRFWKSGQRGGSGLGLFIVKGVVDGHGGSVEVGEVPDGGARMAVWFPENMPDVLRD